MPNLLRFTAFLALSLCALPSSAKETTAVVPLPHAHSHNDYNHTRPLKDAIDRGFCSVEADVFLVGEKLMVGHEPEEIRPGRTLQALYLDPLLERVRQGNGWVYGKGQPVTLLVDFKSAGEPTYERLREVLKKYREMLSFVKDGKFHQGAIDIIVSGNRPFAKIAAVAERYVFVDGRLNDLKERSSPHLIPLVSARWSDAFSWKGQGAMPAAERVKLRQLVKQTHDQHRRLRFWATSDNAVMWTELSDAGVDLIGTDDLEALRQFWTPHPTK